MHNLPNLVSCQPYRRVAAATQRGAASSWAYWTGTNVFSAVTVTPRVRDSLVLRPVAIRKLGGKSQSDEERAR